MIRIKNVFFLILLLMCMPIVVNANNRVNVYIIEQDYCRLCDKLDDYIKSNYSNDSDVSFYRLNIDRDNTQKVIQAIYNKTGIEVEGTPVIVIGNKVLDGYQEKGLDDAIENEKINPSEYNFDTGLDEIRIYLYGEGVSTGSGINNGNNDNENNDNGNNDNGNSSNVTYNNESIKKNDKLGRNNFLIIFAITIILTMFAILALFLVFRRLNVKSNKKNSGSKRKSISSQKISSIIILAILVLMMSGCASNVENNIVGHIYAGCDLLDCYTYIFNDNHLGLKDTDEEFSYVIEGDEVTLYSDRWSNSPVKYKYNSKTKCLERFDKNRTICQSNNSGS